MDSPIKTIGTVIGSLLAGATLTGGAIALQDLPAGPVVDKAKMEVIQWEKPKNDLEWAEDTKRENLDLKTDDQLAEMKTMHEAKLAKFSKQIDDLNACPECRHFELKKANASSTDAEVDAIFTDEVKSLKWEYEKLSQSVERINKEIDLRARGVVITDKVGTKDKLVPRSANELKNKNKDLIRVLNP